MTQVIDRVWRALRSQPGWDRPDLTRPHFRHAQTGVHLMVYAREIAVVFGAEKDRVYDKAVSASLAHFPNAAITSTTEVAQALVVARQLAAARQLADQQARTVSGAVPPRRQ